jgi:hypothetical protein
MPQNNTNMYLRINLYMCRIVSRVLLARVAQPLIRPVVQYIHSGLRIRVPDTQ